MESVESLLGPGPLSDLDYAILAGLGFFRTGLPWIEAVTRLATDRKQPAASVDLVSARSLDPAPSKRHEAIKSAAPAGAFGPKTFSAKRALGACSALFGRHAQSHAAHLSAVSGSSGGRIWKWRDVPMIAPASKSPNDCQDLQAIQRRENLLSIASQVDSAAGRHSAIELAMLAELGDFWPQPSWYLLDESFDHQRGPGRTDEFRSSGFSRDTTRSSSPSPINNENDSASLMRTAVIVMILPAMVAMLAAAGVLLDRAQVGWVAVLVLMLSFAAVSVLVQLRDQLGGRAVTAVLAIILLANPAIGLAIIALLSTW